MNQLKKSKHKKPGETKIHIVIDKASYLFVTPTQ